MDYIEMQQKIINIIKNIDDEEFIKNITTKAIRRREIVTTYKFQNSKKKNEVILDSKGKSVEEKKEIIYIYIDSCNSEEYLLKLINELRKKIKKNNIIYAYDSNDIDDIVEDREGVW